MVKYPDAYDRLNMPLDSNRTKYMYYYWWFKIHSSTSQQDFHNGPHCPASFRQEISSHSVLALYKGLSLAPFYHHYFLIPHLIPREPLA